MSTATVTRHPLARRGAAYTQFLQELDRRGESALHKAERAQLVDCADALLFDEPEAERKVKATVELLDGLVESGRWLGEAREKVLGLLGEIGA